MRRRNWAQYGAGSGAVAVVLFVAGSVTIGTPPDFDAPGSEVAAYFADHQTRIQVGSAILAAMAPFLVLFLAVVQGLAREAGEDARRAGTLAYGCGLAAVTLYMADVAAVALGALRPDNMAAAPELAQALLDYSFVLMGMAALLVGTMFAAFAVLTLRDRALWPRWLGWLAAVAALCYSLRIGTLFTTSGPFAPDGALGLWVPVIALGSWILAASLVLARHGGTLSEPAAA